MNNTMGLKQIAIATKLKPSSLYGKNRREEMGFPKEIAPRKWRTEDVMAWLKKRQKTKG